MPEVAPRTAPGLHVRQAAAGDVDVVVELVQSAYRGEGSRDGWTTEVDLLDGQRTDAAMVADSLADPDALLLVAQIDEGVVGCCELRRPPTEDHASLGLFAVRPRLQGVGVGRRVLDEGERIARDEWGRRRMRLEVIDLRAELIAWYRRCGYEETGETAPFPYGDQRFGQPRRPDLRFVVLEKSLADQPG